MRLLASLDVIIVAGAGQVSQPVAARVARTTEAAAIGIRNSSFNEGQQHVGQALSSWASSTVCTQWQAGSDGFVFLAVDHLDDAALQPPDAVTQHFHLTLFWQRDGALAVLGWSTGCWRQQLGLTPKTWCGQVVGDVVFGDAL